MTNPTIIINGQQLSNAQVNTLYVALESFALDLKSEGLGDDVTGQQMTAAYLEHTGAIRSKLFTPTVSAALDHDPIRGRTVDDVPEM